MIIVGVTTIIVEGSKTEVEGEAIMTEICVIHDQTGVMTEETTWVATDAPHRQTGLCPMSDLVVRVPGHEVQVAQVLVGHGLAVAADLIPPVHAQDQDLAPAPAHLGQAPPPAPQAQQTLIICTETWLVGPTRRGGAGPLTRRKLRAEMTQGLREHQNQVQKVVLHPREPHPPSP